MQTAAKNNLFLTDASSKDVLEIKNSGRLYQQIVLKLTGKLSFSYRPTAALANHFVALAEHAYAHREMDVVRDIGTLLMVLPLGPKFRSIGRYYEGLSLLTRNHWAEARVILEGVLRDGPSVYKAKALLSIGGSFVRAGDLESALAAYQETPSASKRGGSSDLLTAYMSQHNTAIVRSVCGDHAGALADLERMFPVARTLAPHRPQQYYSYLNSLAIELGRAGRTEEARSICRVTVASSYAHAYPEWRETAEEIAIKAPRRSSSIVIPGYIGVPSGNVFPIGADRNASTDFAKSSRSLPEQQARVLSFTNWKTQMSREPLAKQKPILPSGQLTRKQKIIRIVDLVCNEISDDQLDSILKAVEEIAPDEKVNE
jgi:hypothetical protein